MKKNNFLRSFILILLIAALALSIVSCKVEDTSGTTTTTTTTATGNTEGPDEKYEHTFTFEVYLKDATEPKTVQTIKTNKTTVGDALLEKGLIEGEDSQYGLYVKTVDGVYADYNETKTYWAFYINGEYAMTGVDSTNIENGAVYSFRIE